MKYEKLNYVKVKLYQYSRMEKSSILSTEKLQVYFGGDREKGWRDIIEKRYERNSGLLIHNILNWTGDSSSLYELEKKCMMASDVIIVWFSQFASNNLEDLGRILHLYNERKAKGENKERHIFIGTDETYVNRDEVYAVLYHYLGIHVVMSMKELCEELDELFL